MNTNFRGERLLAGFLFVLIRVIRGQGFDLDFLGFSGKTIF